MSSTLQEKIARLVDKNMQKEAQPPAGAPMSPEEAMGMGGVPAPMPSPTVPPMMPPEAAAAGAGAPVDILGAMGAMPTEMALPPEEGAGEEDTVDKALDVSKNLAEAVNNLIDMHDARGESVGNIADDVAGALVAGGMVDGVAPEELADIADSVTAPVEEEIIDETTV